MADAEPVEHAVRAPRTYRLERMAGWNAETWNRAVREAIALRPSWIIAIRNRQELVLFEQTGEAPLPQRRRRPRGGFDYRDIRDAEGVPSCEPVAVVEQHPVISELERGLQSLQEGIDNRVGRETMNGSPVTVNHGVRRTLNEYPSIELVQEACFDFHRGNPTLRFSEIRIGENVIMFEFYQGRYFRIGRLCDNREVRYKQWKVWVKWFSLVTAEPVFRFPRENDSVYVEGEYYIWKGYISGWVNELPF